jgi:hypothetical protein
MRTTQNIRGFPSKTDPDGSHDEPIHPLNTAFESRVSAAVDALSHGADRRELIEEHGSVVVREAESYLRGDPVLRIRQFGGVW